MKQKEPHIGALLKDVREEQLPKWSQKQMASHLGISIKTYRKIERGEQDWIPFSAFYSIVMGLDIPLSKILGGSL